DITLELFLGGGSQGWVYSGRVRSSGALVAVKILNGSYVKASGAAAREAMTLAKLKHPNVPRVFRFQAYRTYWVVIMELVQGDALGGGPLTLEQKKLCISRLADTVWHLSEARIVHRDIKPANIVLRYHDHTPVLVDFGLAVDLNSPLPIARKSEF